MSKLLSLARLQDQPGRCGTAATPRPPQAAAIRCKERMAAAGGGLGEAAGPQRLGWSWRRARLRSLLILASLSSYRTSLDSDRLCSS